jgi:hypothetical protein
MKKTLSDKKFFNDIVRYIHEIITFDMQLEALPDELPSDWRERKKVRDKKKHLQFEIIRAQVMLRKKIDRMMLEN